MKTHREINVPVSLCAHSVRVKICPALRLLVLLKLHSDGTLNKKDPRCKLIESEYFNCSKTYIRQLMHLKKLGWIWINKNSGIIHLNSFDKIQLMLNDRSRARVRVHRSDLKENKYCRSYFAMAVIGEKIKRNIKGVRRMAESTRGDSNIPSEAPFDLYYGYGVRKIAEILGCSIGTAQTYKKRAEKIHVISCNPKKIQLGIHKKELGHLKKADPENANRLWPTKGYVCLILNDEIIPHLSYCSIRIKYYRIRNQEGAKRWAA